MRSSCLDVSCGGTRTSRVQTHRTSVASFLKREQVVGEAVVVQGAGATLADASDGDLTGHAKRGEDQSGDEARSIEAHVAVRQDAMAVANERRSQAGDRVQFRQIGERLIVVVEREVDVQAVIRLGWNARV